MSCNTFIPIMDLVREVEALLAANYIDKDDPRITGGVFTNPTIKEGFLLDVQAREEFCRLVQECGLDAPFGKMWLSRPLYPDQMFVSYEDSGEPQTKWKTIQAVLESAGVFGPAATSLSSRLAAEIDRATTAENEIISRVEVADANIVANEESIATNVTAISTESNRAFAAEGVLTSAVEALELKDSSLQSQVNSIGGGKKAYVTYALMEADKDNIPANSSIDVTNDTDPLKNGTYSYDGAVFTKSMYDVEAIIRTKVLNTFKTKALMDASALPNGADAQVTDDTINNGQYVKTAGAWVKSEYDPLTLAKSYTDSQGANLLAKFESTKFPNADLIVRRYLTTGEIRDYAAGTYQTASPDGLKVAVTASGSNGIAHYFRTKLIGFNLVTAEFEITAIIANQGEGVGVGFIDDTGQYIMYYYSVTGNFRKIVNHSLAVDIATGLVTSVVGDKLKIEVKSDKVLLYKNNVLVYAHDINPTDSLNGREILFGQIGFSQYTVTMAAKSDPVRDYVDNKIAQVVPDIPVVNNPKAFYQFNKTGGASSVGLMTVYTQIKDNSYVGFDVAHEVDMRDIIYQDYWRIVKADFYTLTDGAMVATGKTALTGGESEFVWKQTSNKVDFTGGYHGDEIVTDLTFLANGLPVSLSADIALTACNTFEYIEKSTMHETANKDSDPFVAGHPVIANHIKNTSFYDGGYKTYNKITFNYEGTMSTLYHGISCISKDAASTVIAGNDFTSQAMTGSGLNYFDEAKARDYIGYNTTNNLSSKASARIINNDEADLASTFFVHDRNVDSKYYRKSPPKNVVVGEAMESEFSCFFNISSAE